MKWLHFSDCINNGGTSQLFIDFSPSTKGKKGQVVRFLHDPDQFKVIADSFETYLKKLMDNEYDFIDEDDLD
ncbi:SMI1/KNR4 family protein [Flavicella sp.]|uniref:SMI1/KNR4 family protein n=1 Tax=Flavicella sp. TaxID=2957742 RepID=UPI00301B5C06